RRESILFLEALQIGSGVFAGTASAFEEHRQQHSLIAGGFAGVDLSVYTDKFKIGDDISLFAGFGLERQGMHEFVSYIENVVFRYIRCESAFCCFYLGRVWRIESKIGYTGTDTEKSCCPASPRKYVTPERTISL